MEINSLEEKEVGSIHLGVLTKFSELAMLNRSNLGIVLADLKDLHGAKSALLRAIEIDSLNPAPWHKFGK